MTVKSFHERHRRFLGLLEGIFWKVPLKKRLKIFERSRGFNGNFGIALRFSLIKTLARSCGDFVTIFPDVYIKNPQNIDLGSHVSIHSMCYIDGGTKTKENLGITIGDHVSIAHGCTLIPSNHVFTDPIVPIRNQPIEYGFIHIQSNVWLGAKVTILNNVTVASGCVLGAGTVVVRDTKPNGVYVGVPARWIKNRIGI